MWAISKYIFSYIETIVITLVYISIGIYFFPKDPLILHSDIPFLSILLIVITLFNGSKHGVVSLVLVGSMFYLDYHQDMLSLFLSHLLLVLILGQFYHYWYNKNEKSLHESAFTKKRLKELSHAFYALKISHNILEKSYALKPQSLRTSIKELESLYFKDELNYEDFLNLISKEFHLQGVAIAELKNDTFNTLASTSKHKTLNLKDLLVEKTLQSGEASYINQVEDMKNNLYIAIIPIKNEDDIITNLLAIENMPFLEFNQNTIINIAIIFSYFIDQQKLWKEIKELGFDRLNSDALFTHSYNFALNLQKRYKTASSVIVIKAKDDFIQEKLIYLLEKELRGLDKYFTLGDYKNTIIILLPLSPKDATLNIIENVSKKSKLKNDDFSYMSFDIEQKKLIYRYIKET